MTRHLERPAPPASCPSSRAACSGRPRATPLAVRIGALFAGAAIAALSTGCANTLNASNAGVSAATTTSPFTDVTSLPAPSAGLAGMPASTAPDAPVAVPAPVDPLRPEVVIDLDSQTSHADLWGRVRRGFVLPDLDTDLVRDSEQWYAARPDYVARMTERGSRYLFYIVDELERRNMPTELALLPFIESAFNPQAMSSAKASGMWQFIPSTGKFFSLKQNVFRDDRRDVLASTRAALDYLAKLHDMFGDWHLALAAYNWGEGSVQRAIARNQKLGLPTDYLSLSMPNETRQYLPKLQAVKNIVLRPEAFSLKLPGLANHPYFLSVPIDRDIDVAIAAKLAGLPIDEFKTLNPQMNKPVILAAGTPQVLLPYDNASQFLHRLSQHRGPLATWTAWIAPKTVRPAEAARAVGMTEQNLRDVNVIPPRMLVKAGSTLLVPRGEGLVTDVSGLVADNATMSLAPDVPPLRKLSIRAGKRDSVASVAARYRVSTTQLAQWNRLGTGATFRAGQAVVLYVPTGAALPRSLPAPVAVAAPPVRAAAVGKASTTGRAASTRVAKHPAVARVASGSRASAKKARTAVAAKPVRIAHR